MKLLISAYRCDPAEGGEPSNGWNHAYYNAKMGHEVWCFTTTQGKTGIRERLLQEPLENLHVVYVHLPGWLDALKRRSPEIGVYFHYLYWQYKAYLAARKLDEKVNFELVHHATYCSLQLGSFMWKLQKPMLFGPVGGGQTAPPAFKKYFGREWKQERLRNAISFLLLDVLKIPARTLQNASLTLTCNQETTDLARQYNARRVASYADILLPDDLYPSALPVRHEQDTLSVLWVGRILSRKGLLLALEALAQVTTEIPIHLTIIGDGPLGKQIPVWIRQLGLETRVTWVGRQPFAKVKEAYACHDVFMFCSLRDTSGAQLAEAAAFGLPILTLNHHGAKVYVSSEAGIKAPVTTPEATRQALTEALLYLYHHPEERRAMSEKAFIHAQGFAWSKAVEDINVYYQEIVHIPVEA